MKKTFLILIAFSLIIPQVATAQSTTPVQSKVPSAKNTEKVENKIDELKDKVASRVAELKLVEKRGVVGVVESVTDTQITVNDLNDKTRYIDVDELTKFSSDSDKSYGISDIEKGTKITAIGLYNKESERLLARFVNEINIPLFLNGVISDKDAKEFTITLSTEDEKQYTVDVEKITKTFTFEDGDLVTSGFSDTETLQNALIIGFTDPEEKNRITASKIIIFPDLPKNPKIEIEETSITPTKSLSVSPSPKNE